MLKKLTAAALAIALTVGAAALPMAESGVNFANITANAADLTSGFWQYSVNDDGTVNIKGYTGFVDTLNIPSKIDGRTVTSIGDEAFENSTNFDSVVIPSTVTSIGCDAFYESGLKSVTIPSSVNSWGTHLGVENYSFRNCDELTTVVFNAETIPNGAFYDCDKLKTVTSSAKYIDGSAFISCDKLSSFTNKNDVLKIGDQAFQDCTILSNFNIGNKISYIGRGAFENSGLKSVTIPSSFTSWSNYINEGNAAFKNCDELSTVVFKADTIPEGMFNDCDKLKTVTSSAKYIEGSAFDNCGNLSSFTNKNDVLEIGGNAFENCTSLTSFDMGSKVTHMGRGVFNYSGLKSITIPSTVQSWDTYLWGENGSLYNCNNLKTVYFGYNTMPVDITNASGVTFYCYPNSDALQYAKDNKISYKLRTAVASTAIKLNKTSLTMEEGYTYYLDAVMTPSNSTDSITWVSGDTSIATVNNAGVVTAKSAGLVSIKATTRSGKTAICNITVKKACNNNYNSGTVTKKATCDTTGLKEYTCACGAVYNNTIDKLGHSYTSKVVAPTYAAQGYTKHTCSRCGYVYKDNYKAKKTVKKLTAKTTYTCTTNAVRINWNKVSEAEGYKIERYNDSTKKWVNVGKVTKNTTLNYKDSGLAPGKTYKYRVRAYKIVGGKAYNGAYSSTITTKTDAVPKVTAKTTFTCTSNAVRINWNKASNVSGYKVLRYNTSKKKWETIKTISGNKTFTYLDSNRKAGTTYKYCVKAYVKSGSAVYYGTASSTITTATKPAATAVTKSAKATTAIRLCWKKVSCTGYRIDRYDSAKKKWVKVKAVGSSSTTQYRISGLKKNTTYKFRIVPYVKVGTKYVYGAASSTYTVKTSK